MIPDIPDSAQQGKRQFPITSNVIDLTPEDADGTEIVLGPDEGVHTSAKTPPPSSTRRALRRPAAFRPMTDRQARVSQTWVHLNSTAGRPAIDNIFDVQGEAAFVVDKWEETAKELWDNPDRFEGERHNISRSLDEMQDVVTQGIWPFIKDKIDREREPWHSGNATQEDYDRIADVVFDKYQIGRLGGKDHWEAIDLIFEAASEAEEESEEWSEEEAAGSDYVPPEEEDSEES